MPNLPAALDALKQMAWLLDNRTLKFAAPNRYERVTNAYQDDLTAVYDAWVMDLVRRVKQSDTDPQAIIADAMPTLLRALQDAGQANLPYAVDAIGEPNYIPSPDAWRMIADAIDQQNRDLETRLIPYLTQRLNEAVAEGNDLQPFAESLMPRVAQYAGNLWTVTQRLVGDFADQAATRDDLIYPCRWVRTKDEHSCGSCIGFEGEYASYDAMLIATNQCVPGYFVGTPYLTDKGKPDACWSNCRCHLELKIDGTWTRI